MITAVTGTEIATDIPAVTEADNPVIEYNTYIIYIAMAYTHYSPLVVQEPSAIEDWEVLTATVRNKNTTIIIQNKNQLLSAKRVPMITKES